MLNHKGKKVVALTYGDKVVAVVTSFHWAFKSWVKSNGRPGEFYYWVNKESKMNGISFNRYELANFALGPLGVSKKVLEIVQIRIRPTKDTIILQKEYAKEYACVYVEYRDGTTKEFEPEEWAIFEEGLRKIITKLIFINK